MTIIQTQSTQSLIDTKSEEDTPLQRWHRIDVHKQESRLGFTGYQPFTPNDNRINVYNMIRELQALETNWDQCGAPPIDPKIILAVLILVNDLSQNQLRNLDIVPIANGTLQLEWDCGPRSLEIELESCSSMRYLKWDPGHDIEEEGVLPLADKQSIFRLIKWVLDD